MEECNLKLHALYLRDKKYSHNIRPVKRTSTSTIYNINAIKQISIIYSVDKLRDIYLITYKYGY